MAQVGLLLQRVATAFGKGPRGFRGFAVGIGEQRVVLVDAAVQRVRSPGAAGVDQDDVAIAAHVAERRMQHGIAFQRRLSRTAGDHVYRIGFGDAAGRHQGDREFNLPA